MLLIFVGIVRDRTAVDTAYVCNDPSPFALTALRLNHLAARYEHLAALALGYLCEMPLKFPIAPEPVAPLRFAGYVLVKKADMRTPCAVFAVYRGL